MKILLIDNDYKSIEVLRLTPDEEHFMNDYESDENMDLLESERLEKILEERGYDLSTDYFRYNYLITEGDVPVFDQGSDEPVYVI